MILDIIRKHLKEEQLIVNKIKRDDSGRIIYKRSGKYIGVYWLMSGDDIVYIGYSGDLIQRLKSHSYPETSKVKNWDFAKCIIVNNKRLAKSIEFSLLVNIPTRYNSPRSFRKSDNLLGLFSSHQSRINSTLIYLDELKTPNYYKKYYDKLIRLKNMSYDEFVVNYELRIKGEPCDLVYSIPNIF